MASSLEALVEAMGQSLEAARADNLAEVIDSYPRVHRTATIILGAFTFRSWKSTDPVLTALDVLHQLYASEQRKLPAGVPPSFLTPAWRKLIGIGPTSSLSETVITQVSLQNWMRAPAFQILFDSHNNFTPPARIAD